MEATTPVKLPAKRCPPILELAPRQRKGRISTAAPHTLACMLRSLRPILHIRCPGAALSCSKGSRGLFVPSRVIGIITDTTISLGSWLRQRPDHYTIRAGRNLPDKEFRYLRTVIVTAAVYRGLNSYLHLAAEHCSLPSGTGPVSGCIRHISSLHSPVFLLNSCLDLFSAPPPEGRTLSPEVTGSFCLVP